MSMWDKLQKELDRAGDAARGALDEGKLRIDLFRVRQMADKAAEALGYAVHRARREGKELEPEVLALLPRHHAEGVEAQPGQHAFADRVGPVQQQVRAGLRQVDQPHRLPPAERVQVGFDAELQPRERAARIHAVDELRYGHDPRR